MFSILGFDKNIGDVRMEQHLLPLVVDTGCELDRE